MPSVPASEVERRAEYLQEIGNDHPLMAVIHQCLSNVSARRPEAPVLLDRIDTILSALPQQFTNRVEMLQQFEARIQTLVATNQSKQSEIDTNRSEIDSKQSEIESLRVEVERLSVQSSSQQAHSQPSTTRESDTQNQPQLLHPQAKLQWKRCADMPVGMARPQVVSIGEKVYIGGGLPDDEDHFSKQVFQYDTSGDEWSRLPPCQVIFFAMAHFAGNLITVGGWIPRGGGITGKVYCFRKESQKWEEFLKPMPTARYHLSVATTQSAIVASGGVTDVREGKSVPCTTVEVYSSETSQWHTADSLPVPCRGMTSVTIADTWYQLGGGGADNKAVPTVQYAPLTTLIQKATSPTHQSASHTSVWKTLPDTPLKLSAAASLSGNLLAVGGYNDSTPSSPALYVFFPLTNSWVRVTTGDLPQPRCGCTAVQLSSNQLLVVGGRDGQDKYTNTVFLGSITIYSFLLL